MCTSQNTFLKMLADAFFFFRIKTGESSFFTAEDFELYYRLAGSYKEPFLSQLNSAGGNLITQESLIQSI